MRRQTLADEHMVAEEEQHNVRRKVACVRQAEWQLYARPQRWKTTSTAQQQHFYSTTTAFAWRYAYAGVCTGVCARLQSNPIHTNTDHNNTYNENLIDDDEIPI